MEIAHVLAMTRVFDSTRGFKSHYLVFYINYMVKSKKKKKIFYEIKDHMFDKRNWKKDYYYTGNRLSPLEALIVNFSLALAKNQYHTNLELQQKVKE